MAKQLPLYIFVLLPKLDYSGFDFKPEPLNPAFAPRLHVLRIEGET